ncbi:YbhB/YbcL family Raf kinase inhibitor-like protein [Algiphilus sp.]|uniref:YbhB/YbcL family Raf kinase inhibitor-like protein n=1 Tax=Algiphilus sp. TaxID=1872431 RepID=UPI003B51E9A5
MRSSLSALTAGALLAFAVAVPAQAQKAELTVSSTTWSAGESVPMRSVYDGFGCTGGNRSPQVSWSQLPEGTQSLAVTIYDPDAPTGSGWWHWIAYNIPADTTALEEGAGTADGDALPEGALQARNDFGAHAYGGPCPPEGDDPHRYQVRVFALPMESLPVPEDASAALIGFQLNANALAVGTLEATFGR